MDGQGGDAWVIDCETTGVGMYDRVVTFAGLGLSNGMPTGKCIYLVFNPARKSSPIAQRLHGFSDDELGRQEKFSAHAAIIRQLLADSDLIIGHNIGFDLSFLNREFRKAGLAVVSPGTHCTMQEYRWTYPNRKAKLDLCLREFGLKRRSKIHNAFEDVMLTAKLYQCMNNYRSDWAIDNFPDKPFNYR